MGPEAQPELNRRINGKIVIVTLSSFRCSSFLAWNLGFAHRASFAHVRFPNVPSISCHLLVIAVESFFSWTKMIKFQCKNFDHDFSKNKSWFLNSASLALARFQLLKFWDRWMFKFTNRLDSCLQLIAPNCFTLTYWRTASNSQQLSMLCSKLSNRTK